MLQNENAVLRRQINRVRYQPGDRLWLAALSQLIPRRRWGETFAVTPTTRRPPDPPETSAPGLTHEYYVAALPPYAATEKRRSPPESYFRAPQELTLGYTGDGKRQRRKVSGKTKAAVVDKLRDLRTQLDKGATPKAGYAYYTVRQAAEDWLAHGLDGRSPKTVTKNQNVLEPILKIIGARKLRDLTAADVGQALAAMAAGYSTAAVNMGHLALKRAIRHAEASDLVTRNVATLADTPKGQHGRPSRSLTLDHAVAVVTTARTLPVMELRPGLKDVRRPAALMHAYIVLSLLCGLRTEEARALRWAHVDLDGDPAARPPVPPHVAVWRSVRAHGDTKTERSRRTLALPAVAVHTLRAWADSQAGEQLAAGRSWQDTGLVFTSHLGAALDAGNVRKMFKRICTEAGAGDGWTPRELRTTFVSLMSHQGVSIEEIARLVGHATTRTT